MSYLDEELEGRLLGPLCKILCHGLQFMFYLAKVRRTPLVLHIKLLLYSVYDSAYLFEDLVYSRKQNVAAGHKGSLLR